MEVGYSNSHVSTEDSWHYCTDVFPFWFNMIEMQADLLSLTSWPAGDNLHIGRGTCTDSYNLGVLHWWCVQQLSWLRVSFVVPLPTHLGPFCYWAAGFAWFSRKPMQRCFVMDCHWAMIGTWNLKPFGRCIGMSTRPTKSTKLQNGWRGHCPSCTMEMRAVVGSEEQFWYVAISRCCFQKVTLSRAACWPQCFLMKDMLCWMVMRLWKYYMMPLHLTCGTSLKMAWRHSCIPCSDWSCIPLFDCSLFAGFVSRWISTASLRSILWCQRWLAVATLLCGIKVGTENVMPNKHDLC